MSVRDLFVRFVVAKLPKIRQLGSPATAVRTFLSRRSFSEGGCSMRITEDVRKFAAEQRISEEQALQIGLEQKAREFVEKGSEIYAKA